MTLGLRKAQKVGGVEAPPPRPTLWAAFYAFLYLGLPIIGILLILDLVLYAVFRFGFGECYGFWC